jgi:hypothetical protein
MKEIIEELTNYFLKVQDFDKDSKIFCEKYLIKSSGRVINIKTKKTLSGSVTKAGYLRYQFSYKGDRIRITAQRLIANCFIPNPENKPQVNHKDGNKLNNSVSNLEWNTASENALHAYKYLGKKPNKTGKGKFNERHSRSKRILQISLNGEIVSEWVCANEVRRKLGFNRGNICSCARGELKSANGYKWQYK